MPHTIWDCGTVGTVSTEGPFTWPKFSAFVVAYKLTAALSEDERRKLERKLSRRIENMADRASAVLGGVVGNEQALDGGYTGIGVGTMDGTAVIPPHDVGSDFIMTYAVETATVTHAEAAALDTWLAIQQYEAYLDVYAVTGGEIHH